MGRTVPKEPAMRHVTATCDACGSQDEPTETVRREGVDLRVCVMPLPCISRARNSGAWCTYP